MKKYFFPLLIMIVTIFFLNTVIDPEEKKPKTEAKTIPIPELRVAQDKAEAALLYKGKKNPKKLSREQVEKAARDLRPVIAMPYEEVIVSFSKNPSVLSITEWNKGKETNVTDTNVIPTVGRPGVKLFIIRGQWLNEGQATYVAKIRIPRIYSYQELLTPRANSYTVIGFFDEKDSVKQMPMRNENLFDIREISMPLGHLIVTFPELAFEQLPTYYVFGGKDVPIRIDEYEELAKFLGEGLAYEFGGESENWKIEMKSRQTLGDGKIETAITFIGDGEKPGWAASLRLDSASLSFSESGFPLDQNGRYLSVFNGYQTLLKTDSILATVTWDGKEELIPLDFKEKME
ncbi:hypothetical protein DRW41_16210 [Neobacillus piezotolerans]|uniref:Uncharacterized protein n=1 Tax=Neobacillus piezotolerans TaxID=2259171 RepID=A0A3D8GMQ2_9BACI|nr:hypothetical protein [Neobacillus piezotolerans]RDU35688.1 hypothetical protein DRW41_16210 [Neobacillus piezotolerans]